MTLIHSKLFICGGQCIFGTLNGQELFYLKINKLCHDLSSKLEHYSLLWSTDSSETCHKNCMLMFNFPISELNEGLVTLRQSSDDRLIEPEEVQQVAKDALNLLLSPPPEADVLLLSLNIIVRNLASLQANLANRNLTPCLKAHLLHLAIECHFYDGVELLLKTGALPDEALIVDEPTLQPLCVAMRVLAVPFQRRHPDKERILQILLDRCRPNFAKDLLNRWVSTGSLETTAWHASRSTCRRIVAVLTDNYYCHKMGHLEKQLGSMVLRQLAFVFPPVRENVVNVIAGCIVPLIQAGIRYHPPYMMDFLYPGGEAFDMSLLEDASALSSCQLFGPHRPKALLDLAALGWWAKLMAPREAEQSPFRDFYASMRRRNFERNLQSRARSAILSTFPVGLRARERAVEALKLPSSVTEFLNFSDFMLTNVEV